VRFCQRTNFQSCLAKFLLAVLMLLFHPGPAQGKIPFRRQSHRGLPSQNLRKKLHVNSLITEPGTFEVEFGNALSLTSRSDFLPTTLKYTPGGNSGLWGRTEFSVGFDSLSSAVESGTRTNQFSDHLSFAATTVLYGGAKLNVAVSPAAFFYLQGDRGARLGAAVIARYDAGLSSAGLTLSWTGATATSPTNPAGAVDLGGGYGRKLAKIGVCSRLTPHANLVYERSSGGVRGLSVFEGMEYQLTERLAIDISGQHVNLWGGSVDHELVLGMTLNLGSPRKWFPGRGSAWRSF
jgi:hypothetical protein